MATAKSPKRGVKKSSPIRWTPYSTPQDRAIKLSERIVANCLRKIYTRLQVGERLESQEMQFALEAYKSTRITKALRDAVPVNELMNVPTKKLVEFIHRPIEAPGVVEADAPDAQPDKQALHAKEKAQA